MQFPITIGLHRSRFLDGAVLLIAVLASAALIGFSETPWRWAGLALVWALSALTWYRLKPDFTRLRLERGGQIFIARTGDADFLPVAPEPGATVHPWLTVVRLRPDEGRSLLLVAAVDSLNPDDFRRLRTFLRWRADFSDADDAV